jgi:hypothetical protein
VNRLAERDTLFVLASFIFGGSYSRIYMTAMYVMNCNKLLCSLFEQGLGPEEDPVEFPRPHLPSMHGFLNKTGSITFIL